MERGDERNKSGISFLSELLHHLHRGTDKDSIKQLLIQHHDQLLRKLERETSADKPGADPKRPSFAALAKDAKAPSWLEKLPADERAQVLAASTLLQMDNTAADSILISFKTHAPNNAQAFEKRAVATPAPHDGATEHALLEPLEAELALLRYAHEQRCLACWQGPKALGAKAKAMGGKAKACAPAAGEPADTVRATGLGGGLRGCDLCPAAFHLACVGMKEEDATGFGLWSCPHHSCSVCGRKAQHVGGLLFRCSVCPSAFCEDHLPPAAILMGENPRYQALGCRHPQQGCYVLHSTECVALATALTASLEELDASSGALGVLGVLQLLVPLLGSGVCVLRRLACR